MNEETIDKVEASRYENYLVLLNERDEALNMLRALYSYQINPPISLAESIELASLMIRIEKVI